MGAVDRIARINELVKRELAERLERETLPGAQNSLVSITEVNTSADLHNATVYVSIFSPGRTDKHAIMHEVEKLRVELQRILAKNLKFKYTPVLLFKLDERTERGDRVLNLLNEETPDEQR